MTSPSPALHLRRACAALRTGRDHLAAYHLSRFFEADARLRRASTLTLDLEAQQPPEEN